MRTSPLEILLVEDDPADVALIEEALATQRVPLRTHHVADGADALAFLRGLEPFPDAPRPDLILLDLNMPRVDGRQVLAEVKADDALKGVSHLVRLWPRA
ncbi:response regulator [Dactylosporangium sp. NPDC050688]|uniref:response regulator n=1 Tax=Dactylosporangium sp. NPDC050688 TaxID=3157217 RepID=UPI0033FD6A95